jgi:hypothetical protein
MGAVPGWKSRRPAAALRLFPASISCARAHIVFEPPGHFLHWTTVEFTGKSQEQWLPEIRARLGWMDDEAGAALKKRHEESWMHESF